MFWIGLYLDGSMVKWAKVNRQKKKISIELLRTFPFSEENLFTFPQSTLEEFPYKIISGLDSSEVLLRNTQVKLQDQKKILKLLPFQIEPQLPCPSEDAVVSVQINPGDSPKSSKISFYAAKKAVLQSHIEALKQKKAEPDEVSCIPAALWRFTEYFFPELSDTLILHLGAKSSTLIGITDKKPCFSHCFPVGSELFSAALDAEGKDLVNLLDLSAEKEPALYQLTQHAKKELDRVFTFFLKKQKEPWLDIILTGNFSGFPLLKAFIANHLPESIRLNECTCGESYDATTLDAYAIPIGLALDGLSLDGCSTKFRLGDFAAPAQKKRQLKLFSSLALACAILASTTLLISGMYRDHKIKQFADTVQSSFSLQHKKLDSLEDLQREVSSLEVSLTKEKVPYSLRLPVPNVSELLAWLSSHPVLNKQVPSEEDTGDVDMKKVKYSLVKYPKIAATALPYIAKVELEVEIPSRLLAKDFQESLQKDLSFIDTKKEISWQVKGTTYFISFFLKPHLEAGKT